MARLALKPSRHAPPNISGAAIPLIQSQIPAYVGIQLYITAESCRRLVRREHFIIARLLFFPFVEVKLILK